MSRIVLITQKTTAAVILKRIPRFKSNTLVTTIKCVTYESPKARLVPRGFNFFRYLNPLSTPIFYSSLVTSHIEFSLLGPITIQVFRYDNLPKGTAILSQ